jgi:hypothetical protein
VMKSIIGNICQIFVEYQIMERGRNVSNVRVSREMFSSKSRFSYIFRTFPSVCCCNILSNFYSGTPNSSETNAVARIFFGIVSEDRKMLLSA